MIGVNKAFVLKKEISLISATVWERYSLVTSKNYYWNEYKTVYIESPKPAKNNEGISKFAIECNTKDDETKYRYYLKDVTFNSSTGYVGSDEEFNTLSGFSTSCSRVGSKFALASNCYDSSDESTIISGEPVVYIGYLGTSSISDTSTEIGVKHNKVHVFTVQSVIDNYAYGQPLVIGTMIRYDNIYTKGQFIQNVSDPSRSKYPDDGYTGITGNYYVFDREEITYGKGDYIDTVTSYNPDEYPANGEQDGYWYIKR